MNVRIGKRRLSAARTPAYPMRGYILMRTEMGKNGPLGRIAMRTERPKFWRTSDPAHVHMGLVGSDVVSTRGRIGGWGQILSGLR